jgi:hypothetical protein
MPGKVIVVANIIVALWGLVVPAPFEVCVVAMLAMPCVSLMVLLIDSQFRRGFFSVIAPGSALIIRLAFDIEQPGKMTKMTAPMFHWCYEITAAFVLVFVVADRGKVWKKGAGSAFWCMTGLMLFTFMYAMGVVEAGNVFLDHSIQHVKAPIKDIDKETFYGSSSRKTGGHTTYFITIDPPVKRSEWKLPYVYDVGWEKDVFLRHAKEVCIDTGNGALGEAWYRVLAWCD